MLYGLKAQFQKVALYFATSGLTANQASILGWVFVLLSAASLYFGMHLLDLDKVWVAWPLLLFSVFTFLRLVFNALDGMIARATNKASPMGELANELGDICGDTICYGILFLIPFVNLLVLTAFLLACWFAEFTGVLGRALPGHIRRHESLLGGKAERSLLFCLFTLGCFFSPELAVHINQFLGALALLTFATGVVRIVKIRKQTQGLEYQSHTSYGR